MLDLSRQLNPAVDHHLGDMRTHTVRLDRKFDPVLVHDVIASMLSEDDLTATFTTAREHFNDGGILLVAPDLVRDEFTDDTVLQWYNKKENIAIEIEKHISDPYPSGTVVESLYTYTIREAGTERVERDRHISGLFSIAVWTRLFEESGFEVERHSLPGFQGYGEHLFCGIVRHR